MTVCLYFGCSILEIHLHAAQAQQKIWWQSKVIFWPNCEKCFMCPQSRHPLHLVPIYTLGYMNPYFGWYSKYVQNLIYCIRILTWKVILVSVNLLTKWIHSLVGTVIVDRIVQTFLTIPYLWVCFVQNFINQWLNNV